MCTANRLLAISLQGNMCVLLSSTSFTHLLLPPPFPSPPFPPPPPRPTPPPPPSDNSSPLMSDLYNWLYPVKELKCGDSSKIIQSLVNLIKGKTPCVSCNKPGKASLPIMTAIRLLLCFVIPPPANTGGCCLELHACTSSLFLSVSLFPFLFRPSFRSSISLVLDPILPSVSHANFCLFNSLFFLPLSCPSKSVSNHWPLYLSVVINHPGAQKADKWAFCIIELIAANALEALISLLVKFYDALLPVWSQRQSLSISHASVLVSLATFALQLLHKLLGSLLKDGDFQFRDMRVATSLLNLHVVLCSAPYSTVATNAAHQVKGM